LLAEPLRSRLVGTVIEVPIDIEDGAERTMTELASTGIS